MKACLRALALSLPLLVLPASCSGGGNSLTGSVGSIYNLDYNSVVITLEGTSVEVKYVGSSGDPARLVVNTTQIEDVAGHAIMLQQLVSGQPRGVLQNVGATTTDLPIQMGTVTFDNTPVEGSNLSGSFAATLANPMGYTLDGSFSGVVNPP